MKGQVETTFSETQYNQIYPDGVEEHFWHRARNAILLHYLKRYRAEPLLEIGAGRGLVLAAFQREGWQAEGVELGITSPRWPELRIRYGQDAFALPQEERARYRSIGLFDVIEHLPDRVAFLGQVRSSFPALRYLYLTVPSPPDIWSNYDVFWGHYLRYDIPTLQSELAQAGYRVLYVRYFFHSLYWMMRVILVLNRQRKEDISVPRGLARLWHRGLGAFFVGESYLVPPAWRGTSLLAVAEPL